jgi:hypothetical protein
MGEIHSVVLISYVVCPLLAGISVVDALPPVPSKRGPETATSNSLSIFFDSGVVRFRPLFLVPSTY